MMASKKFGTHNSIDNTSRVQVQISAKPLAKYNELSEVYIHLGGCGTRYNVK